MTACATNNKCSNYHHGDLRNALIIAAGELIEERGVDFAMIDAARRAGVSSAAPYRHFKDKDALLVAVTQVGFLALTERMYVVTAAHTSGTEECIIAQGKTYVDFVTSHPAFFDLMWGDIGLRSAELQDVDIKTTGFHLLVESVAGWCAEAGLSNLNALELSVKLWATAHGLACLVLNGHVDKFMPGADVHTLMESSTHTFLDGLRREA